MQVFSNVFENVPVETKFQPFWIDEPFVCSLCLVSEINFPCTIHLLDHSREDYGEESRKIPEEAYCHSCHCSAPPQDSSVLPAVPQTLKSTHTFFVKAATDFSFWVH